jgi:hypothetical protein
MHWNNITVNTSTDWEAVALMYWWWEGFMKYEMAACGMEYIQISAWLCLLKRFVLVIAWLILWPWRWRWHVLWEHRLTFSGLHGLIYQKMKLFLPPLWNSRILYAKYGYKVRNDLNLIRQNRSFYDTQSHFGAIAMKCYKIAGSSFTASLCLHETTQKTANIFSRNTNYITAFR